MTRLRLIALFALLAANANADDVPQARLLIIGIDHPDFSYEGGENVRILKNAPHSTVMEAFSKCRFAVFPSLCLETASTVALEAMSQSRAVIATDIG